MEELTSSGWKQCEGHGFLKFRICWIYSLATLTVDLLTICKCYMDIDDGQFWNKMFIVKFYSQGEIGWNLKAASTQKDQLSRKLHTQLLPFRHLNEEQWGLLGSELFQASGPNSFPPYESKQMFWLPTFHCPLSLMPAFPAFKFLSILKWIKH